MPVGAISGVSLGENGAVNLRLRGTGPAAPGMLVVGRRVSSGELATAEVGEDGGEPPAPLRRRQPRSLAGSSHLSSPRSLKDRARARRWVVR